METYTKALREKKLETIQALNGAFKISWPYYPNGYAVFVVQNSMKSHVALILHQLKKKLWWVLRIYEKAESLETIAAQGFERI